MAREDFSGYVQERQTEDSNSTESAAEAYGLLPEQGGWQGIWKERL